MPIRPRHGAARTPKLPKTSKADGRRPTGVLYGPEQTRGRRNKKRDNIASSEAAYNIISPVRATQTVPSIEDGLISATCVCPHTGGPPGRASPARFRQAAHCEDLLHKGPGFLP